MTKRRLIILAVLIAAPFLFLAGVGSYHLYTTGWAFTAWWPMAASITLAYVLAWRWTRKKSRLLPDTGMSDPPSTWTDRDRAAWKLVEARVQTTGVPTAQQLGDAHYYMEEALHLSLAIAKHYHPAAGDPFKHLTIPEILACAELVARDLARKVTTYVPGSHLLTVQQWQQARQAVDWGQQAWNLSWLGRAILDPFKAGVQFAASKAGGTVLTQVQNNVLAWFHTAYLHELGRHLIELNSGRLRVGAQRYTELLQGDVAKPIAIAVVGQVKAGKSSLINALLGDAQAGVDVVPLTNAATKYELKSETLPPLTLVDTPGYGAAGPTDAEFLAAFDAAKSSDVMLIVLHARTAARTADIDFLQRLHKAFTAQQELRPPVILGVATHIDALTPAAEWSPPYDIATGTRPKETSIRDALQAIHETLPLPNVIPVAALDTRVYNVVETLLPAMAERLTDARGVQLLKSLHYEARAGATKKTLDQALQLGKEGLKVLWNAIKK